MKNKEKPLSRRQTSNTLKGKLAVASTKFKRLILSLEKQTAIINNKIHYSR